VFQGKEHHIKDIITGFLRAFLSGILVQPTSADSCSFVGVIDFFLLSVPLS
jgi:hypothetical protein